MPKITKTTVDNLKPQLLEQWVWDTELPGFGLRCTPVGRKTFVLRYRTTDGKQRKQAVALAGVVPVDRAREMARKILASVAEGADPMAERRAAAPPPETKTVECMFKAYVASMRAKGRASAAEVERALLTAKDNAADAFGRQRAAGDVTPMDVVNHVSGFFKRGHRGAADKQRSYIASAFAWAMRSANDYTVEHRQAWGITSNPAVDVPRDTGAITPRDRNLSAEQLKALWQATRPGCEGFAPETAACIRLLIACGQRVQETLRLHGSEVDLQAGLWRMPAEKTKGKKLPHAVPLPAQVIPDLQLLVSIHGQGALFPSRSASTPEQMGHHSVMQAIERWYLRMGAEPLQTRDLRRTWKSRAHDAGVDRFTRDLIQQHAKNDTGSKSYDRAEYLPQMREAMDKWSNWIRENLEDAPPALQLVA
jgi:integrase